MPAGTKLDIFLFHGSPDILVHSKPIAVIGCKKVSTPYSSNSAIPEEVSQLAAYVHQMMVVSAVNKLVEGTEYNSINGMGLYVMKCGKCVLLKLTLSDN